MVGSTRIECSLSDSERANFEHLVQQCNNLTKEEIENRQIVFSKDNFLSADEGKFVIATDTQLSEIVQKSQTFAANYLKLSYPEGSLEEKELSERKCVDLLHQLAENPEFCKFIFLEMTQVHLKGLLWPYGSHLDEMKQRFAPDQIGKIFANMQTLAQKLNKTLESHILFNLKTLLSKESRQDTLLQKIAACKNKVLEAKKESEDAKKFELPVLSSKQMAEIESRKADRNANCLFVGMIGVMFLAAAVHIYKWS